MTTTEAFEVFLREYQDMVFATAVRLLGNSAEAEDVSQTVFMKAFERFADIGASPSAAGWLKTVTTNACLNHLSRHRSRWKLFSELDRSEAGEERPFETTLVAPEPAEDEGTNVRHDQLEQALRRLPDQQRVPLVLFHFEEKSYQEIAGLLSISLGKVKTDIHRGREALRKHLSTP